MERAPRRAGFRVGDGGAYPHVRADPERLRPPLHFLCHPVWAGNSRSVPAAAVVEQVGGIVAAGGREVVLTGVDLTAYGRDLTGERLTLGRLVLRILAEVPDLSRLRLSSIDSVEVDDALLAAIAGEPRLMPHLHLSLQAGDDLILKRMKAPPFPRRGDPLLRRGPRRPAGPRLRRGPDRRLFRPRRRRSSRRPSPSSGMRPDAPARLPLLGPNRHPSRPDAARGTGGDPRAGGAVAESGGCGARSSPGQSGGAAGAGARRAGGKSAGPRISPPFWSGRASRRARFLEVVVTGHDGARLLV